MRLVDDDLAPENVGVSRLLYTSIRVRCVNICGGHARPWFYRAKWQRAFIWLSSLWLLLLVPLLALPLSHHILP